MMKTEMATRFGKAVLAWLAACLVFYFFHHDLSDTVLAIWFIPALLADILGIGRGFSLDKLPWLVLMPMLGLLLLFWASRRSSAATLLVSLWYLGNMAALGFFLLTFDGKG